MYWLTWCTREKQANALLQQCVTFVSNYYLWCHPQPQLTCRYSTVTLIAFIITVPLRAQQRKETNVFLTHFTFILQERTDAPLVQRAFRSMWQKEWPLIQLLYCVKIERLFSEQVTAALIPHLALWTLNQSKLFFRAERQNPLTYEGLSWNHPYLLNSGR